MFFDPMRVATKDNIGKNWTVGLFTGNDAFDGKDYIVTTDYVRASQLEGHTAKDHAYLFAAAPNLFHAAAEAVGFLQDILDGEHAVAGVEGEAERVKRGLETALEKAISPELRNLVKEEGARKEAKK